MEQLKLENQLCFPFYSVSRLIIRKYQPYLSKLGITYPQYLVLMVLWENDGMPVNTIAQRLFLQTNTVTPLLTRLEKQDIISRRKGDDDERKVLIHLTKKGKDLEQQAADIPFHLVKEMSVKGIDLIKLRETLHSLLDQLKD